MNEIEKISENLSFNGRKINFHSSGTIGLLSVIFKLNRMGKKQVIILPNPRMAREISSDLGKAGIENILLSDLNILPFEHAIPSREESASRIEALHGLIDGNLVISDVTAILKKTAPVVYIKDGLKISKALPLPKALPGWLLSTGYSRVLTVRSVGEFSIRGGIIDVFSPVQGPVRIESFDVDIESIRTFDPQTQLSVDRIDTISLFPISEFELSEPSFSIARERLERSEHPELAEDIGKLNGMAGLFWKDSYCGLDYLSEDVSLVIYEIEQCKSYFSEYEKEVTDIYDPSFLVLFRAFSYASSERLDRDEIIHVTQKPLKIPLDAMISLPSGMMNSSIIESRKSYSFQDYFQEIEPEMLVVHEDHGIGLYKGTEIIEDSDGIHEYLKILYRDGAMLYTPIEKFNKVEKYIGSKDIALSDINGKEWRRTKERVRENIENDVKDLVKLYAMREHSNGFAFLPQRELEEAFAKSFGYLETPDQMKAIEDVFEDMESNRAMDRLICGDAGFGKTEVVLRAAFRAVVNGKQVAMLAPTLILARQHYETFRSRMEPFGIAVTLLSSQSTLSQRKSAIDSIKAGKTDIVIGTHSIISDKISFKDLGLVIIDEEQRFGTKQKEFLKRLRLNVDVLTLSATPIPRTLHMALSGIKTISVIQTPPMGRIPPQIYVTRWNEKMIISAILKEINRGGQVFYVHNRIEDINKVVDKLKSMLPSIIITCVHGRMSKQEFEKVFDGFYTGKIDVLVATSVIENGVDIPNANTLIVDDVERYGLAQLYQIKGRVGRSNRKSYVYLMYTKVPSEIVMKRLEAIKNFNESGGAMSLALKDMEIRGVGEVLGLKQHGQIDAIGLQMYKEILDQTIRKIHGEKLDEETCEPDVSLPSSILPEKCVEDPIERMKLYRRLAGAKSIQDVDEVRDEIVDRFGKIPSFVEKLFDHSKIRILMCDLHISKISTEGTNVQIAFKDKNNIGQFASFFKTASINLPKNVIILFDVIKNGELKILFEMLLEYKKHVDQKEGVA
uniref:Transcription-repair-coupling factor n=1 Tax=Mesoaciditoga lauensis TaxID=1495039 RepID=A0A7V3RFE6_9BACT